MNRNDLIEKYKLMEVYHKNMERIIEMFMVKYPEIYGGVPVFYGNKISGSIGYNQFICKKVGIFSSVKRKYIINPVLALAWNILSKDNYIGHPLYDFMKKILRFDYKEGNKGQNISFNGLPKLEHLQPGIIFCIVKDENRIESVESDDLSKCSKLSGCSLRMTAIIIEEENIEPDEEILEFLDILLMMYLKFENMFREPRPSIIQRQPDLNNQLSNNINPLPLRIPRRINNVNNRFDLQSRQRFFTNRTEPLRTEPLRTEPFTNNENRKIRTLLKKKEFNLKNIPEISKIRTQINKILINPQIRLTVNRDLYSSLIKRLDILQGIQRNLLSV
jgi:hypothetical protein